MENREIKIKAWHPSVQKMFEWKLVNRPSGYRWVFVTEGETNISEWDNPKLIKLLFTGLPDKNGKEIYEGDIVKYYSFKRYVQQSHADVNPEIDEHYISPKINKIVFEDGCFQIKNSNEEPCVFPINEFGLTDIEYIKEMCGCVDDESTDCNGNEINESVLGIEVIGNIYENESLLTSHSPARG